MNRLYNCERILIGLISHNRLDFTYLALDTLMNTNIPFDLLIVDNGSDKETKSKLFQLSLDYEARFISIENRNCNGARDIINHYGLEYDYVIYLDNDAILPKYWLESIISNANATNAGIVGVSQSDLGIEDSFCGFFEIKNKYILFKEYGEKITKPQKLDWVTGHCLMIRGDFLRLIWKKYNLWERKYLFPIDLDDIDIMMMAKKEKFSVFAAPIVIPQNRNFSSYDESIKYNLARNDFQNYALSCVSFWDYWGYNPLLNWNRGYSGKVMKSGVIHNKELKTKFRCLVDMLRDEDTQVYNLFLQKLDTNEDSS